MCARRTLLQAYHRRQQRDDWCQTVKPGEQPVIEQIAGDHGKEAKKHQHQGIATAAHFDQLEDERRDEQHHAGVEPDQPPARKIDAKRSA